MRWGKVVTLACVATAIAMGAAVVSTLHWQGGAARFTIGLVQFSSVDDQTIAGVKDGLAELGYRDGENVTYEHGGAAGSVERLPEVVERTLARGVDLVVVSSSPATRVVLEATRKSGVPVVFAPVNDPIGAGIVTDLAHPGGRVTGVRLPPGDDLRLQWLKRIVPRTRAVLIPYVPSDRSALNTVSTVSQSAPALGVDVRLAPVASCDEVQEAIKRHAAAVQAVFLPRDSLVEACIDGVVATSQQLRLPVSAPSLTQVKQGALFSYGFVHRQIGLQAARLAAQVLRGVSPGNLPVEAAENVLAVNPKAAAAIGLTVPDDVLVMAEFVERE